MVVDYSPSGQSFHPQKAKRWSETELFYPGVANFAIHPDGKRVAIIPMPDAQVAAGSVHATFLLNFFDDLRFKVPNGFR